MQGFTRTLCLYIIGSAIALNVAGSLAQGTAEGLERRQAARTEKLCKVNPIYCK